MERISELSAIVRAQNARVALENSGDCIVRHSNKTSSRARRSLRLKDQTGQTLEKNLNAKVNNFEQAVSWKETLETIKDIKLARLDGFSDFGVKYTIDQIDGDYDGQRIQLFGFSGWQAESYRELCFLQVRGSINGQKIIHEEDAQKLYNNLIHPLLERNDTDVVMPGHIPHNIPYHEFFDHISAPSGESVA